MLDMQMTPPIGNVPSLGNLRLLSKDANLAKGARVEVLL